MRSLVHLSGVVLQGLSYARSGAVIAAATTSLPEGVGTARTWDYRYSWVRDASMTLRGLWVAACPDEATRVGWPGGVSPPGSHGTVRDSLPSHGSSHPGSR